MPLLHVARPCFNHKLPIPVTRLEEVVQFCPHKNTEIWIAKTELLNTSAGRWIKDKIEARESLSKDNVGDCQRLFKMRSGTWWNNAKRYNWVLSVSDVFV